MAGLTLFLGMVECFFGYRMLKIVLGVTGFIVGGLLCSELVYEVMGRHPVIALIAGFVGGAIGSLLMIGLFPLGLFILGAVLGLIVGEAISRSILGSINPIIVLSLVMVGGVAAIVMFEEMIIISTSFVGAYIIVISVGKFIGMPNTLFGFHKFDSSRESDGQFFVMLLFSILIGIAGMFIQHKYTATSHKLIEKKSK